MSLVRLPEIRLDIVMDLVHRVYLKEKADEGLSCREREREGEGGRDGVREREGGMERKEER